MPNQDQVVLLLTHRIGPDNVEEAKRLRRAGKEIGEFCVLFDAGGVGDPARLDVGNVRTFTFADLVAEGFLTHGPTMVPCNAHVPVLKFFQDHPGFWRYWVIEYDVRYTGDWAKLLKTFSAREGDFITSHIRNHRDEPGWPFWRLSHPQRAIPLRQRLRCFHPIYCMSNPALAFIYAAQRDGWRGHSEVLLPTLLYHAGFTVVDFGGSGPFVPKGLENQHYIDSGPNKEGLLQDGTMRFRPVFGRPGDVKNKLYHPVKPELAQQKPYL